MTQEEINKIDSEKIIDLVINHGYSKTKATLEVGRAKKFGIDTMNRYYYPDKVYQPKTGNKMVAKCKSTGKEYDDIYNSSGALTTHLNKIGIIFPNELNTKFKKNDYYYKTKGEIYWYELYFDIIEVEKEDTKKCHYCNWETTDIDNRGGHYGKHLDSVHNITIEKHLEEYPNDIEYFKVEKRKKEKEELFENVDNYVECLICNEKFKQLPKHLTDKHDITTHEYKIKFGFDSKITSKTTSNKNILNLIDGRETIIETGVQYQSKSEKEISDFLKQYIPDLKVPDRKLLGGIEIDMISHEHKIGIEYNGLRYHSELFGKKDKHYHINKTNLMNEKGYQLIHIFEDEFLKNKKLVLNKLLHIFNIKIDKPKIYARDCTIKEINNNSIINKFLNNNHIQGKTRYDLTYGAYNNNKLIAVMCFDSRRINTSKNTNNEIELVRFCTDNNFYIVGIFSKIFKYFINKNNKKYDQVISFADLRWTNINNKDIYKLVNFKITKILKPDYYYLYKQYKRLTKYSFGKGRLKVNFPDFYDINKSEWEIMQDMNYDRIWDCGKIKYIYNLKEEFKINKKGDE